MKKIFVGVGAGLLAAGVAWADTVASSLVFRSDPASSLLWKTVTSSDVEMVLDWPGGATRAELSIVYPDGHADVTPLDDPAAGSATVHFGLPADAASETVVRASVTYYAAETPLKTDTASLGLVQGTGVAATVPFKSESSPLWARVKGAAVLPIPEDAQALAIDNQALPALDAPGWYFWKPELGEHTLALSTAEADPIVRTVNAVGVGMLLLFR